MFFVLLFEPAGERACLFCLLFGRGRVLSLLFGPGHVFV